MDNAIYDKNDMYLPSEINHHSMAMHSAMVEAADIDEQAGHDAFMSDALNDIACDATPKRLETFQIDDYVPAKRKSFEALRSKFVKEIIAAGILKCRGK